MKRLLSFKYGIKKCQMLFSMRFNQSNSFYDSQSGSYIKSPTSGIRLHGLNYTNYDDKVNKAIKETLSTIEITLPMALDYINKGTIEHFITNITPCQVISQVSSLSDLDNFALSPIRFPHGITLNMPINSSSSDIMHINTIITQAKTLGLLTQIKFKTRLNQPSTKPITILDEINIIAKFADIGIDHIIYTVTDEVDDYTCQTLIEECFGIDVYGSPMTDRLVIQGNSDICSLAIQLGVTRLLVSTGKEDEGKGQNYDRYTSIISIEEAKDIIKENKKELIVDFI